MSNYLNITISDFQNICRTCLSRGDLKPLYEKCFRTRCLAETLMFCTGAMISKDDGLPANICTNCISEVNRRFSFAKLCETSDIILRKCLAETLTQSQEVEEKVLEIKQEMPRTVKEVLVDYKYVETQITHEFDHPSCRLGQEAEVEKQKIEIKQEDVKIGLKLIMEEVVKDFEYMKSEQECLKTETEFENNSTPSQKVEFINEPEEEVKIEIKHELISPKCLRTGEEFIEDYKYEAEEGRQIKKEFDCCKYVDLDENAQIKHEFDNPSFSSRQEEEKKEIEQDWKIALKPTVEEVDKVFEYIDIKEEDDTRIEQDYNNPGSRSNPQIGEKSSKDEDSASFGDPADESYEEKEEDSNSEISSRSYKVSLDPLDYHLKKEVALPDQIQLKPSIVSRDENNQTCDYPAIQAAKENDDKNQDEKTTILDSLSKVHTDKEGIFNLNDHNLIHPNTCSLCSHVFSTLTDLVNHMRIHTGERPYLCAVCGNASTDLTYFASHMRSHSGEKTNVCSICNKAFTHGNTLNKHKRIHSEERPYSCGVCNKSFKQSCTLKDHTKIHSEEKQHKPHVCSICSKGFTTPSSLKVHMRTHTGEKPYVCSVCSKAYRDSMTLKHHMKKHTGEKPYKCKVCSKAFIRPNTLKYHMGTHSAEKPYTCNVCSKTFARPENLKEHMKQHTGERKYKCEICSKAFVRREQFEIHMRRRHTGEKPFKCYDCSKSFAGKSALTVHMIVHTGVKSHVCTICSKRFTQISSLKRHMSLHTGKKP